MCESYAHVSRLIGRLLPQATCQRGLLDYVPGLIWEKVVRISHQNLGHVGPYH